MTKILYAEILRDSHDRLMASEHTMKAFFEDFYRRFLASGEVRAHFRDTDMAQQRQMLRRSLQHVLAFSVTMTATDFLVNLAKRHGRGDLDISPALYDTWLEALIATVRSHDPEFNRDVETAWRVVLAPSIAFMRSYYAG